MSICVPLKEGVGPPGSNSSWNDNPQTPRPRRPARLLSVTRNGAPRTLRYASTERQPIRAIDTDTARAREMSAPVTVFLSPSTKQELTIRAAENCRTLSGEIRLALRRHLEPDKSSID